MRNIFLACGILCVVFCFSGCGGMRPLPPYTNQDQALLIGKVDSIDSGWFSDSRHKAKLHVYRLNPDGSRTFVAEITSDYSVLAVQPGIYGLSKTYFFIGSGLTYVGMGYQAQGKANHAPLFEPSFWALTELEQSAKARECAVEFFGIIKVEARDVIYYGDMTLDIATNKKLPMFVTARNKAGAEAALQKEYPGRAAEMKDGGFVGAAFLLGKIRKSRSAL